MFFNYCEKCGTIMRQVIKYNCGFPVIEYICPIHGIENIGITYSNKLECNKNLNFLNTIDYKEK